MISVLSWALRACQVGRSATFCLRSAALHVDSRNSWLVRTLNRAGLALLFVIYLQVFGRAKVRVRIVAFDQTLAIKSSSMHVNIGSLNI